MKTININIFLFALLLLAEAVSAAEYQRTGSGMTFSWQETDYVGVYTTIGKLIKYYPSSIAGNTATLQSGFGLTDNTTFYAYSPYSKDNWDKPITALPISFLNQRQIGNGNTDHLSAYDYQMSSFTTDAGTADVSFSHIGAILHFCWKLPVDAKVKRLIISDSDNKPFVAEATMDLATQTVTEKTTADTLSITIETVKLAKDNVLNAYLMSCPVNLTGRILTAKLITSTGDTLKAYINGTNVLAGHIYPITIGKSNTDITFAQSAKGMSDVSMITTASNVTAYSPDFIVDTDNVFTLIIEGDVNHDGLVDICDVNAIISVMFGTPSDVLSPDVNHDGHVDICDVNKVISIMCGEL